MPLWHQLLVVPLYDDVDDSTQSGSDPDSDCSQASASGADVDSRAEPLLNIKPTSPLLNPRSSPQTMGNTEKSA